MNICIGNICAVIMNVFSIPIHIIFHKEETWWQDGIIQLILKSSKSEKTTPEDKTIFVMKYQKTVRVNENAVPQSTLSFLCFCQLGSMVFCARHIIWQTPMIMWNFLYLLYKKRKKPYLLCDIYSSKKFHVKMAVTQEVHYCCEKVSPPKLCTFCTYKTGKLCCLNKLQFFSSLGWTKKEYNFMSYFFGK